MASGASTAVAATLGMTWFSPIAMASITASAASLLAPSARSTASLRLAAAPVSDSAIPNGRREARRCMYKRSAYGKELEEPKRRQAVLDQGVAGDKVAGAGDQREVAAQPRPQRKRQEQA